MKTRRRKNQLVITALACMIVAAGYLNFSGKEISLMQNRAGKSSASQKVAKEKTQKIKKVNADKIKIADADVDAADEDMLAQDDQEISAKVDDSVQPAVAASSGKVSNAILKAQLAKEQTRSKNREMLMEMLNGKNVTKEQKEEATKQMLRLSDYMEKESAAEQVLAAKGYADAMVSMSENSVDVMVSQKKLTDVDKAKIEDAVQRKTGAKLKEIVISTY